LVKAHKEIFVDKAVDIYQMSILLFVADNIFKIKYVYEIYHRHISVTKTGYWKF